MILIGLTGGIASGKSTVARLLESKGALLIDADRIWHEILAEDPQVRARIVERFGIEVLGEDGSIDRGRLGKIVFNDAEARRDLEALSHPEVMKKMMSRVEEARGSNALVVLDIPLLIEALSDRGGAMGLDAIVVVGANVGDQIERLIHDRSMESEEAERRIAAQAPQGRKMAAADYIVDNRGSLEDLEKNVDALWNDLQSRFGR